MIIDCISDLHGHYPKLDGGDLLIVAGDLTARDRVLQHLQFQIWLHDQNYRKKIVIAGNHDNRLKNLSFDGIKRQYEEMGANYLCDSGIEFEGLKIWGSPWTKTFPEMNPHCKAFTCETEEKLFDKFEKIPPDTDILITHSPAYSILDKVVDGYSVGSAALFCWLKYVGRPRLHIFGHIHEGYGQEEVFASYNDTMMKSVNCSIVNERYEPVNKPVRVIL